MELQELREYCFNQIKKGIHKETYQVIINLINRFSDHWDWELDYISYVRCPKCKLYYTPFYFGDKPMNRSVLTECKCGNSFGFIPRDLPMATKELFDLITELKKENKMLKNKFKREKNETSKSEL